tara:strand:- start:729 stop:1961 length:1233 start_codon:yes stop_codon:yes gene_type:complete
MVGRLGTEELAAVSLSNSFFNFVLLFGIGLSYGITPLISSSKGENKKKSIGVVLYNGLLINFLFAIFLSFILIISKFILLELDQNKNVLELTFPYLDVIAISLIPLMIFQTFKQYIEGLGFTKQPMVISVVANVLNIVLNYLLIFGVGGFPRLEVLGAGYASLISRVFMMVCIIIYVLQAKKFNNFINQLNFLSIKRKIINKILGIGVPSGFQFVFEIGSFSIAAVMIGWFGAEALASHQIALNLASITYMIATGISASSMISLGYFYGKKNYADLKKSGYANFIIVSIMMGIFGVLFILFRKELPAFYIDDPDVIILASNLIIIAALFQIPDGIQSVGLGVLRGIRDTKVPTLVTFVAYWIIAIPLCYFLGVTKNYGPIGIWIGLMMGLWIAAIFHLLRFSYITKKIIR